ncbi:MAG: type sorting protein [Bacteroidetes bacterium]|nr:type sorting protein [Bacteroidota bacterium]
MTLVVLTLLSSISSSQVQPRWRLLATSPSDGPGRHDDVFFINPQVGWVVNGSRKVYKTTNGGATWQLKYTAASYLRCVGFADSLTGWAGSLDTNHVLYSTIDGGDTWVQVQNFPALRPAGICGLSVVSRQVVYGSGAYFGSPRVLKTTDGGSTWSVIDMRPYASALVDCFFFNQDSGFVVGSRGVVAYNMDTAIVLFTSNGGSSWVPKIVGLRDRELSWKITFPSPTIGYASIERFPAVQSFYFRTTDRGQTWQERSFIQNYDVQGIGFTGTGNLGWIGGWGGPTYETTDGGGSWHLAGFGSNVNRIRMLSDTLGYAVGARVYKYSRDSTVNVRFDEATGISGFSLAQNYLNPFNPRTRIGYTLARLAHVRLVVFDLLGREIATLVDENQFPGEQSVEVESERLASGIYMYQLAAGSFTSTRKMIVVK